MGPRTGARGAAAFGFDGRLLDGEAVGAGGGFEGVLEGGVFELLDDAAIVADQELGGVGVVVQGAGDEGGEAFEAVDEAVFEQEVEGAVDGGRGGPAAGGFELVEQIVGAEGAVGGQDEGQDLTAELGEACAPAFAQGGGLIDLCCHVGWGVGKRYHITYV